MTQLYRETNINVLLHWILLIVNNNYSLKRHDGKIWLYDHKGLAHQYIDDPLEDN